jgi:hypothetical protein
MSVVIHIGDAELLISDAKECCKNQQYLKAYKHYWKALSYFDKDEEKKYPRVSQIVTDTKKEMELVGNQSVLHNPFSFADLAPFTMDPFCQCRSPAKGHFCTSCCDRGPITIARVHKVLEKNKKERTAELEQMAILARAKRQEIEVLEEKLKRASEDVEYLEEALKCTREEATDAEERVKRYRGW